MQAAGSVYGWRQSKGSCGKSLGAISWLLGGAVTCIRYDVELPLNA